MMWFNSIRNRKGLGINDRVALSGVWYNIIENEIPKLLIVEYALRSRKRRKLLNLHIFTI